MSSIEHYILIFVQIGLLHFFKAVYELLGDVVLSYWLSQFDQCFVHLIEVSLVVKVCEN